VKGEGKQRTLTVIAMYTYFHNNSAKVLALGLLLILFIISAYYSHSRNLVCAKKDQSAYMDTAIWLKEHGGAGSFLPLCWKGEYQEANRHPLYILFLSTFAAKDIRFFTKAKILTSIIAFIFFMVFFLTVKKELGFMVSAISTSLLITSNVFTQYLSFVTCEYTFITFTFLTWYFTAKGFDNNKLWIWGGFFNGLAYMSKASGQFFLLTFVLTFLIIGLKSGDLKINLKNKYFYLYLIAFLAVSSPLLIRNVIVYSNPFYNYNQKIMWLDNWEQHNSPELMNQAGMSSYFRTHSLESIALRFAVGFKKQGGIIIESFSGIFYNWIYYLIFILAIISVIKDKNLNRKIYTLSLIVIIYMFNSFYAKITSGLRFYMPLTSILMVYSGIGVDNSLELLTEKIALHKSPPRRFYFIIFITLLSLINFRALKKKIVKTDFSKNLLEMYAYPDGDRELASWMKTNLNDKDVILQIPPGLSPFTLSTFFSSYKGQRINVYPLENFETLSNMIKVKQVTHVIITMQDDPVHPEYQKMLNAYLEGTLEKGLMVRAIPPGWNLVYSDSEPRTNFIVFKVNQRVI